MALLQGRAILLTSEVGREQVCRKGGAMNRIGLVAAIAATFLMAPPTLAEATAGNPTRTKDVPTKVESYYRVKWGSLKDFVALYE